METFFCERLWSDDHITECFRTNYILFILPVILTIASVGIILLGIHAHFYHGNPREYQQLLDNGAANRDNNEFDRVRGEQYNQPAQMVRSYTEIGLNFCALSISLVSLYKKSDGLLPCIGQIVVWGLLTFLATARTCLRFSRFQHQLWYNSAILYCLLFLSHSLNCTAFFMFSASHGSRMNAILVFIVTLSLSLLVLMTPTLDHYDTYNSVNGLVQSRERSASILSKLTLSWLDDLVWLAYTKGLTMSDVWDLDPKEHGKNILEKYDQTKIAGAYGWSLFRTLRMLFLEQSGWTLLSSLMLFLPPVLMRGILTYIDDPKSHSRTMVWLYATLLLIGGCIGAIAEGQSLFGGTKTSLRIRSIMIGEIYAKALRRKAAAGGPHHSEKDKLSKPPQEKSSNGVIMNLMAVDAMQVSDVGVFFHYIPEVPSQLFLAVFLLFRVLGLASLVGIIALIIILPLNYYISSRYATVQKNVMNWRDKRVSATNEVLQNIRIIKYFAWDRKFLTKMDIPRRRELGTIRTTFILSALGDLLFQCAPIIVTLSSFWAYTFLLGKTLTAPVAFTSLSLFNLLRLPLDELIEITTRLIQGKISLNRIASFLGEEETDKYNSLKANLDLEGNPRIELKEATLTWDSVDYDDENYERRPSPFHLHDIDVCFTPERLNLIIGPTGSGKSSLLLALLGEMTLVSGEIFFSQYLANDYSCRPHKSNCTDCVAYCAQTPWLLNDTIRNNILFSHPFCRTRYKSVITACALKEDLDILRHRDNTEIGDKGITLSGGQNREFLLHVLCILLRNIFYWTIA